MVTKKVIDNLYKRYNRPPKSADELDIATLFERAADNHGLVVDEDTLYIGSVNPDSPFAELPLSHINAIVEFDNVMAIVLPTAMVFLEKYGDGVNIHVKLDGPSLWDRFKMRARRNDANRPDDLGQVMSDAGAHHHVALASAC